MAAFQTYTVLDPATGKALGTSHTVRADDTVMVTFVDPAWAWSHRDPAEAARMLAWARERSHVELPALVVAPL